MKQPVPGGAGFSAQILLDYWSARLTFVTAA